MVGLLTLSFSALISKPGGDRDHKPCELVLTSTNPLSLLLHVRLSSSLADFWGRRWNITTSSVLRTVIHDIIMEGGSTGSLLQSIINHQSWITVTINDQSSSLLQSIINPGSLLQSMINHHHWYNQSIMEGGSTGSLLQYHAGRECLLVHACLCGYSSPSFYTHAACGMHAIADITAYAYKYAQTLL